MGIRLFSGLPSTQSSVTQPCDRFQVKAVWKQLLTSGEKGLVLAELELKAATPHALEGQIYW